MERRRLVRVPASSANLGPGFDAFAAALALHTEIEVVETGRFAVVTDLAIAKDRRNLAVRGFERLHAPDAFEFRIRSEIPLSGGLGTSAAAYVAGPLAADHLFELDADILALATELEGHPDNVAAALLGGFVVCADGEATRFDAPTGLEAIVVVPHEAVRTREARAALPPAVPMADAVHNVAHASLLVLGLARGDWDLGGRRDAAGGAEGRRGAKRGALVAARASPRARRLEPRRARTVRPPAPAAPRAPLSALDGPRRARPVAGRAGGDDLRRGPDRAGL